MSARVATVLSRFASRAKDESYLIDEGIGAGYLLHVVIERVAMKVRGLVLFPGRSERPSVGARARVRSKGDLLVGRGVTIGADAYVDALSVDGVRLGDHTTVGRGTRIECTGSLRQRGRGLTVGRRVGLGTDSFYGCAGGVTIGDDTIVGNFVSFHSENHVADRLDVPIREQGVTHAGIRVGAGCWIGAKVTVLDGAQIGDGCIVAAGAVVAAGTYPPNGIYGGVPARLLKTRAPRTEVAE
ncbi:acyltransferase [Cellulomonas sp. NS3]|uniref:acyltransferase n=1 Tax=Cellulomonas sp. NS3 TaxID=2973977 RepID=UPI0021628486|nr:acyltransferase [Cellulomonas sp. NS3]